MKSPDGTILTSNKGGDIFLQKIVKNYDEHDASDDTKLKKLRAETDERFAACLHLHNSDMNEYYSLMKGLNSQYSLKNKQFPANIIDAHNVLSNHKWDKNNNFKKNNNDSNKDTNLSFTQKSDMICFVCGKKGTL